MPLIQVKISIKLELRMNISEFSQIFLRWGGWDDFLEREIRLGQRLGMPCPKLY
jgi:hypothetical protein